MTSVPDALTLNFWKRLPWMQRFRRALPQKVGIDTSYPNFGLSVQIRWIDFSEPDSTDTKSTHYSSKGMLRVRDHVYLFIWWHETMPWLAIIFDFRVTNLKWKLSKVIDPSLQCTKVFKCIVTKINGKAKFANYEVWCR